MTKKERNSAYRAAYKYLKACHFHTGICEALEDVGYSIKLKPELYLFKEKGELNDDYWVRRQYNRSEDKPEWADPNAHVRRLRLCILEFCIAMTDGRRSK